TAVEGSGARVGVLDPLGVDLKAGEEMYFSLMRGLASSLVECLTPR
ncbi:MAG: zinc ABC transporter substrate-binding protein, partial [Nitrospinaceae bacterium]|nr:zinc ABC transporter substrate-binding protein [Nitrospinaceae bacterium]